MHVGFLTIFDLFLLFILPFLTTEYKVRPVVFVLSIPVGHDVLLMDVDDKNFALKSHRHRPAIRMAIRIIGSWKISIR